ncbi:MAG: nicotinate-nucleotide--dimethylbenzimidazole phosphoribosyltransferase [Acidimicrobiia bacterium]
MHDPALDRLPADVAAQLVALVEAVTPLDAELLRRAEAHHDRLTKPQGSLGRLEVLGAQLCAIAGEVPPPVPDQPVVAVFAADHGVLAEGVSPWPQEVTGQMVLNFCAGGAAINAVARRLGARVAVIDVGVATALPDHPALHRRTIRNGTANLAHGPAMTLAEAAAAMLVGADTAAALVAEGADLLVGGDMGIGNTTASAAVIGACTGRDAVTVTGRGTGIDDGVLARKQQVVADAMARAAGASPLEVLAEVGGLEIAALAGFLLGAAGLGVPVVLDGVITLAAACVATGLCPSLPPRLIAGHRSTEPGASVALAWLGVEPLIDLGLRLGEGSGAALAAPLVQAAAAVMAEMATFDAAGVADKG